MYVSPGIVTAFHGCTQGVADAVLKNGESLQDSINEHDWLGHGIYFWEGSEDRAKEWAKSAAKKVGSSPAVIGAFIRLGNCLDLLDTAHTRKVKETYELLEAETIQLKEPLPKNKDIRGGLSFKRELDCRVILHLQQINEEIIAESLGLETPLRGAEAFRKVRNHDSFIDSVRGMFPEGKELYPGAGFRSHNHIQICVVNPNCIIGYFDPRPKNSNYKLV